MSRRCPLQTIASLNGCLLLAALCIPYSADAVTRYVSPSGLHVPPFISWEDAATNIQTAINACDPGDTVLVTNGVYELASTLRITNDVTVVSVNGRDVTMLDGAALPAGSNAVFLMFGTLDGFTVSNAPLNGVKSEYGAVFNSLITHSGANGIDSFTTPRMVSDSTLVVTNTIVRKSSVRGIVTCAVDTRIVDCVITESTSAGISFSQNDNPSAGAIQIPRTTNVLIRSSTISSNLQSGITLAIYWFDAALPNIPIRIEDSIIEGNSGGRGAGISDSVGTGLDGSSGVQINRCVIRRNVSTSMGGGVYLHVSRSPSINQSVIEDNQAAGHGGGVYMFSGFLSNSALLRNQSAQSGGGAWGGTLGLIYNCTLINNQAANGGGTFQGIVRNSIIYYNTASVNPNVSAGSVAFSCMTPLVAGTGNISVAPGVAGLNNPRLVIGSPCVDAGSLAFAAGDFDIDGEPRIWGGGVDMGYDELFPAGLTGTLSVDVTASAERAVVGANVQFQCNMDGKPESYTWLFSDGFSVSNTPVVNRAFIDPGVYTATVMAVNFDDVAFDSVSVEIFGGYTNYVSPSGLHISPFTNWVDAATNIQSAIEANIPGGVVMVDDGTYDSGGVTAGSSLTNRVAITNAMDVISANGPAHTFIVGQGPLGNNAVRCAYVGPGARLIGFTLTNGHTRTSGSADADQSGGGIWCAGSGVVMDGVVRNNSAYNMGGGIRGGQIFQSSIFANTAQQGGGANGVNLTECVLSNNTASANGGGAHGGSLVNGLVVGNSANNGGGLSSVNAVHCSVVANHAANLGGGVYLGTVHNSIVYFNTAGGSWTNFFNTVCSYTCTTPDPEFVGNIIDDPLFVDAAGGNFRLQRDSPCIDAAQASAHTNDLARYPRPIHEAPDMGAYEYSGFHYVAPGGGHVWPYLSWTDAATNIQAAVDAADATDTVLVSNGVYNVGSRLHLGSLSNRVVVDKAVEVRSINGPAVSVIEGQVPIGAAAIRGVYLGQGASLVGFTVRGGATRSDGDPVLDRSGGGIWAEHGASISNSVITDCTADAFGGGVYGGRMVNAFLRGNTATFGGGASDSVMDFCTIIENEAVDGGGAYGSTGRYSIVYFNVASGSGPNTFGGDWDTCCITPDPGGPGHITADPLFLFTNDYRLAAASPCIDAVNTLPGLPAMDIDETPRPLDGNANAIAAFDIGAYEYVHPVADTDGDGLSDSDEIYVYGTNPLLADTDGDGQTDLEEVIAGTNPLDPNSFFAVTWVESDHSGPVLYWPGAAGRLYTILMTPDMTQDMTNKPSYVDQPGWDGLMSYTNPAPGRAEMNRVRVRTAP